jgi:hypothetical protein
MPSVKGSSSGDPLMFVHGSTAIDIGAALVDVWSVVSVMMTPAARTSTASAEPVSTRQPRIPRAGTDAADDRVAGDKP